MSGGDILRGEITIPTTQALYNKHPSWAGGKASFYIPFQVPGLEADEPYFSSTLI